MDDLDHAALVNGAADAGSAQVEEASSEFLGRWNRLVSTTNWEKGRIISEWRQALLDTGAPATASSDEAWSRRVGNVSSQHVGRLRRVFERFGTVYAQYQGLYWSHFQAALDWHDAEMWLEGAVQNEWSVALMRQRRWETIGTPTEDRPQEQDVAMAEFDEDVPPAANSLPTTIGASVGVVQTPDDGHDSEPAAGSSDAAPFDDFASPEPQRPRPEPVRPFENVPALPDDLAEAVEAFKLAIVHHRVDGWRDVSCDAVLAALDALKGLALAPLECS